MAIQYAHALAPWFLEEPCPPENVDALALVARSIVIPVAAGERRATRYDFRTLLEKQACAIIQPDVCHCGGISEIRKIAAMAETYYIPIAPHNPFGPIATMANVHVGYSVTNYLIQEVIRDDVPWRYDIVDEPEVVTVKDGYISRPNRPGLGLEINEKEAAKYPFQQEPESRFFHSDGSVADW